MDNFTCIYVSMSNALSINEFINPYEEYVLTFARNHGISISEACNHPMCKARLEYFKVTGK